jgi:RNA 3'-phosphate cyclase
MIYLEGSYLEAGGQIVRTALALSALTGKAFEVKDIRKGRCNPGLAHQHVEAVRSVQKICDAHVEGADLSSPKITFIPRKLNLKSMEVDIRTAGSITLLMQALLLPCLFSGKKIKITVKGGTDVQWSQPFDYFNNVLIPHLRRFCQIQVHLIRRGYYPKGEGVVELSITSNYAMKDDFNEFIINLQRSIPQLNIIDQGYLQYIKGVSHASHDLQEAHVAERQAEGAKIFLKKCNCPVEILEEYANTRSTGSGITLWAIYSQKKDDMDSSNPIRLGADSLGEKGKKAEIVGKEAAERLIKEIDSKSPIDQYLSDQILPFLALVKGTIRVSEVTSHCKTNMYVIEQFLGIKFEIEEKLISVKSHFPPV